MKRIVSINRKARRKRTKKRLVLPATKRALPENLETEFLQFMEYHSAKDFGKNLRKMLLEFLMHERSVESIYLKDLLYDIDGLFDLLDVIESEVPAGG